MQNQDRFGLQGWKNLAGEIFIIWFLAKLDNSVSLGKSFFSAFFSLLTFKKVIKDKKAKNLLN